MARRSAAEKAATHARIVQQASEAFRASGTSVGISDVMKDLGLTHGGFYRHFGSKDDLLVDAVVLALEEVVERLVQVAEAAEPGRRLEAIITAYLSKEHQRHPETWCALASLLPDLARLTEPVRRRLDGALQDYMKKMLPYMPGADAGEKMQQFAVLFSGMAGAMAMSRAFGDAGTGDQVLAMTREYYLRTFGETETTKGRE